MRSNILIERDFLSLERFSSSGKRARRGRGMKRRIGIFALLVGACALLSGCDKCTGGWQEIQLPGAPKTCADNTQR
jgi:hypothetical protein